MSDGAARQAHPWLRLLRVPNLLTAPGDALAGGVLAAEAWPGAEIWAAGGAMLLVYAGGLVLNDYFDMARDAVERPERPLPSGQVTPWAALIVAVSLLAAGPALAWLACGGEAGRMALVVAFLVVAYDAGGKRMFGLGPLLMGACRGGSVLVGAVAAGISVLGSRPTDLPGFQVAAAALGAALLPALLGVVAQRLGLETLGPQLLVLSLAAFASHEALVRPRSP